MYLQLISRLSISTVNLADKHENLGYEMIRVNVITVEWHQTKFNVHQCHVQPPGTCKAGKSAPGTSITVRWVVCPGQGPTARFHGLKQIQFLLV